MSKQETPPKKPGPPAPPSTPKPGTSRPSIPPQMPLAAHPLILRWVISPVETSPTKQAPQSAPPSKPPVPPAPAPPPPGAAHGGPIVISGPGKLSEHDTIAAFVTPRRDQAPDDFSASPAALRKSESLVIRRAPPPKSLPPVPPPKAGRAGSLSTHHETRTHTRSGSLSASVERDSEIPRVTKDDFSVSPSTAMTKSTPATRDEKSGSTSPPLHIFSASLSPPSVSPGAHGRTSPLPSPATSPLPESDRHAQTEAAERPTNPKKSPAASKLKFMTTRLKRSKEDEFSVSEPTNFRKFEVTLEGSALHSKLIGPDGQVIREVTSTEPAPAPAAGAPAKKPVADLSLRPQPPAQGLMRIDLDALRKAMKEMDGKNWGDPDLVDYWSSRPIPPEQWIDVDAVGERCPINLAIKSKGYHIEMNGKCATREVKIEGLYILEADDDFPYFKEFFSASEHDNYLCPDGPCVVSALHIGQLCKAIVRTKKEDQRILLPSQGWQKALKAWMPALKDFKLVKNKSPELIEELADYERTELHPNCKFGLVYCKEHERDEDSLFGAKNGSPAYDEFLGFMGERIVLQGWSKYRAGLDVKANNTGTHSIYTQFRHHEIMFHVATLLPYDEKDTQKVERKRHIGNDVVVIVFKDQADESDTFDPTMFTSHFIHCIFVVVAEKDATGKTTHYRLTIANKPGVPPYPPFMGDSCRFEKCPEFRDFFLAKMINAGRAALASPEFNSLMTARRERLSYICQTHGK